MPRWAIGLVAGCMAAVGCGRTSLDGLELAQEGTAGVGATGVVSDSGGRGHGGSASTLAGASQGGSGMTTGGRTQSLLGGESSGGIAGMDTTAAGHDNAGGDESGAGAPTAGGEGGCGGLDCGECPNGTYLDGTTASCVLWSDCLPGELVSRIPDASHDRLCLSCPAGTTSVVLNVTECDPIEVTQIATNEFHSCARFSDGTVRCWGLWGALGNGNLVANLGDDEHPSAEDAISVTTNPQHSVMQVAVGMFSSCALLTDNTIKCWGASGAGQLGKGSTDDILDPSLVSSVELGSDPNDQIEQLVAGQAHVCVRLASGEVRCWGANQNGQLGQGNVDHVGDTELPSALPPVSITSEPGVTAVQIAAGSHYTCAILSSGAIKCWGEDYVGQLGYGNADHVGDDELPSSLPDVRVSHDSSIIPTQIVAGYGHTCVLLSDHAVKCWGYSDLLGYAGNAPQSPPRPADLPPISISPDGAQVVSLTAGEQHTCALLSDNSVRCWGASHHGQLGYGNIQIVGDDELPSEVGSVNVVAGDDVWVTALAGGGYGTCAILSSGEVKCWGWNLYGMLGQANTEDIGDNELPSTVDPIQFF